MSTSCGKCLCVRRLWERLFGKKELRVLFVGLDAAGKTTILYQLKLGEVVTTIPTIGFNVESVNHGNVSFVCWDVGGKDKIRPLWRHYYQGTQALVFVVDSNDLDRIDAARDELHRFMNEEELREAAILVFANKQDLPNAMSGADLIDALGLRATRRQWHLQPASAISGDGLYEGFDWLEATLLGYKRHSVEETKMLLTTSSLSKVVPAPEHCEEVPTAVTKAVVADKDLLLDRSFIVMRLDPEAAAVVLHALEASFAYLSGRRTAIVPSDYVRVSNHRNLEASEAHWEKDRSQLRIVDKHPPDTLLGWVAGALPRWEIEEDQIVALRQAQTALASLAAPLFGVLNTATPAQVAAASALDAFYYFPQPQSDKDGEFSCAAHTDACAVTLLVSDAPGLEVCDARTSEWVPLNLCQGEVAVLAGRSAREVGIDATACKHRVRRRSDGLARTSLSLDIYASPALSPHEQTTL